MKDKPIMCITEVLDDDSGIWTNCICDTSTDISTLERILRDYGKEGYKEILDCLSILKKDLENAWKEVNRRQS